MLFQFVVWGVQGDLQTEGTIFGMSLGSVGDNYHLDCPWETPFIPKDKSEALYTLQSNHLHCSK